jgi:hypothetical protein
MEADWAKLSSRSSASTASDWAKRRTDSTSCNATDSGTATGWAALGKTAHSTAWAGLGTGGHIDDSDNTDADGLLEAQNVNATSVLVAKDVIGNLFGHIYCKKLLNHNWTQYNGESSTLRNNPTSPTLVSH